MSDAPLPPGLRVARVLAYLEVPRCLAGLGLFLLLWALPDLRPARSEYDLDLSDSRSALALLAAGAEAVGLAAGITLATGLERRRRWVRPLGAGYGVFDAGWHLAYAHVAGLGAGWASRVWVGWAVAQGAAAALYLGMARGPREALRSR